MMGDQVRTLEYRQAMIDFCNMFPGLDKNVIECVLRTNNGHVESTIDQLLQLTENNETSRPTNKKDLRKLYYTLQSPSPTFEAPPMYSAVFSSPTTHHHNQHQHQLRDKKCSATSSPRHDNHQHHNHRYKDWNPPLLGTLPTDFLRIKERPTSSSRKTLLCTHRSEMVEIGGGGIGELDERKIACLLKNEEFLKELRNNKAFMNEVKKLMKSEHQAAVQSANAKPLEDVSFKDNLKHMSKYARSTFYDVARKFTKKKSYKSMNDNNVYNDCDF